MADSGTSTEPGETSQESSQITEPKVEAFDKFYTEVKQIEQRDSVLTNKQQIDRLCRPGHTYFNLNPFDVLMVEPDIPLPDIKKKFRQMSLLVHPDKNQEDTDRAQSAFEAVNKAWKTLENEEGYKRCGEIVEEAQLRVAEMVKTKKKALKKEGKAQDVPEDDDIQFRHAVYVQTCKLFADLERMRQEREAREMHERKRKAEEEALDEERQKVKAVWNKNYEESRTNRVDSWRTWKKGAKSGKKKATKGAFRPPQHKQEQR